MKERGEIWLECASLTRVVEDKKSGRQLNEDMGGWDGVGEGCAADRPRRGRGHRARLRGQVVLGRKFDERKQRRGCSRVGS